jgi:hypothetical protein
MKLSQDAATKATSFSGRVGRMFRNRANDRHRSAVRLSLLDAVVLAPVIALPLIVVVGLALFSMVGLLVLTGLAVAATIIGDIARRYWRSAKQPIVVPRRALG